jgi:RNA polymerase sigma-B factor
MHDVFSDWERRAILYCLQDSDGRISVERLAAHLVGWWRGHERPAPTDDEVAHTSGLTRTEVEEAVEAGRAFGAMSLDAPVGEESPTPIKETIGTEDAALADAEQWWMIEPILDRLSERDQQVLHMRFFEDMSQSEIAEVIGVSQMQISRILSAIFKEIKSEVPTD